VVFPACFFNSNLFRVSSENAGGVAHFWRRSSAKRGSFPLSSVVVVAFHVPAPTLFSNSRKVRPPLLNSNNEANLLGDNRGMSSFLVVASFFPPFLFSWLIPSPLIGLFSPIGLSFYSGEGDGSFFPCAEIQAVHRALFFILSPPFSLRRLLALFPPAATSVLPPCGK